MLRQLLSTATLISAALLAAAVPGKLQARDQRPVFAISHKVMDVIHLKDALYDQIPAVEIDLTAWRKGDKGKSDSPAESNRWWLDHDGDGINYGDPADVMLEAIGNEGEGKLAFVVLDIKTPDYCDVDEEGCGMAELVKMVQDLVLSKGVGVVYGITTPDDADTPAFQHIVKNLDDDASVRITGQTELALKAFEEHGADIPTGKRIIDYGNPYLKNGDPPFGKCERVEGSKDVCPNLVHAIEERDNGNLGGVFMWTVGSSDGDGEKTNQALDAGVDGIVLGYAFAEGEDSERTIEAHGHVISWAADHTDTAKLGTSDERPWS